MYSEIEKLIAFSGHYLMKKAPSTPIIGLDVSMTPFKTILESVAGLFCVNDDLMNIGHQGSRISL